jgi:hypothetical protein
MHVAQSTDRDLACVATDCSTPVLLQTVVRVCKLKRQTFTYIRLVADGIKGGSQHPHGVEVVLRYGWLLRRRGFEHSGRTGLS